MADKQFTEIKFKDGDKVKLKSGGPLMTISSVTDDKVECSWFHEGDVHHDSFSPEVLKAIVGKKKDATAAAAEE